MYRDELKKYIESVNQLNYNSSDDMLEFHFETLKDWSSFHSIDYIEKWFKKQIDSTSMEVKEIPLKDCDKWIVNTSPSRRR